MKHFFTAAFGVLLFLSVIAWWIRPRPIHDGKTELIFVSDPSPARREQIDLFNRLYPQYDLRLDPTNLEMQKVIVQSLGGVGPDIFSCYDSFSLSAYVKSGIAWDITEELQKAGIDYENDLWPGSAPMYMYEGRAYGFPGNVAADAMWFNKDIFDSMGVPYPVGVMTWDEFIPLAQKMTVRDERGRVKHYGFFFDAAGQWIQFVYQFGGKLYTDDGTRCLLDSPEAIAAAQFMYDLMFKYKVSPSASELLAISAQGGWGGDINLVAGGKMAMAVGGRWWLAALRNVKGLRMGAFECPHAKLRVFRGYGKGFIINKASPRREQAFDFIRYLSHKEYNMLINHQADALAPVKKYSFTEEYLNDPAYPEEDFNAVWRDIMQYAIPEQVSPFVNGTVSTRIMTRQLDLLKAGEKAPADIMRTAAAQINEEIQKTLKIDPELKQRYEKLTGAAK